MSFALFRVRGVGAPTSFALFRVRGVGAPMSFALFRVLGGRRAETLFALFRVPGVGAPTSFALFRVWGLSVGLLCPAQALRCVVVGRWGVLYRGLCTFSGCMRSTFAASPK